MAMTTFLRDSEIGQIVPDKQVQETLQEVRRRTGRDWQIVRQEHSRKRFMRPTIRETRYSLYLYVGGVGPWQVINFRNPDPEGSSIYHSVNLGYIGAYLYGILAGLDSVKDLPEEL